jgi:hypothetical protein
MYQKVKKYSLPFFILVLLYTSACEKEYSYEGGATPPSVITLAPDSIQAADTIHLDEGSLPNCLPCINTGDIPASSWSFKTGNSFLCGEVDTAFILDLERSTFTFFGPATCGTDTGLIFTVSLGPNGLDRDIVNLPAANAVFYYYHTNAPYILLGHADQPFSLIISSYNHSTKLVEGTFSGTGFRQDGRAVNVTEGKFKIRLI